MGMSWLRRSLCGLALQQSFDSGMFAMMEVITLMSFWSGTATKVKEWDNVFCGAEIKSNRVFEHREEEALYLEATIMGR